MADVYLREQGWRLVVEEVGEGGRGWGGETCVAVVLPQSRNRTQTSATHLSVIFSAPIKQAINQNPGITNIIL